MKWNESGFRPLLCTYRLNWARRTSWGWWDDWDDTVLQTQNSFEIHPLAIWCRARYLSVTEAPQNTDFHTWMRKKHFFVSFKPTRPGTEPRTLTWRAAVLTTTLGPPLKRKVISGIKLYIDINTLPIHLTRSTKCFFVDWCWDSLQTLNRHLKAQYPVLRKRNIFRAKYWPTIEFSSQNVAGSECIMFSTSTSYPANTKHLNNICTTPAQRLQHWSNIVQIFWKCLVFPG